MDSYARILMGCILVKEEEVGFVSGMTFIETRIKLYNTLALPVLLYGSETWTNKARDARRITAAEMKY
jgi:hypothetical protein